MRNEIYARYGYEFKNKDWQAYFLAQDWYKPSSDNVDAQLTEIERHNIKIILGMKEKIKINKALYTKLTYGQYVAAG